MDFDLYSPISDHGRDIKVDVLDVVMNAVWFLLGCSPMLALIAFELWG